MMFKLLSFFCFFISMVNAQVIFQEAPENFKPKVEVSGCFITVDDQVLFLKRHPDKPEGTTWALPGGKLEKGENEADAICREVMEETGIDLDNASLKYFGKVYVRYPKSDFIYHMFEARLEEMPDVVIDSSEHTEYLWTSLKDSLKMPLILGEDECIYLLYGIKP